MSSNSETCMLELLAKSVRVSILITLWVAQMSSVTVYRRWTEWHFPYMKSWTGLSRVFSLDRANKAWVVHVSPNLSTCDPQHDCSRLTVAIHFCREGRLQAKEYNAASDKSGNSTGNLKLGGARISPTTD